ncbi:MAG: protein kinase [Acidobacteria bacterium]|nr:protein kinase [Acidobacteriota bacterium]MCA1638634.1 protein kinase [Acidobacteriota bacterium]
MLSGKWQKIEEVFEAVIELPPAKREAYLAEVCNGDDDLRHEVEQLLTADEQASDFIESPILGGNTLAGFLPDKIEDSVAPHFIGRRIGAYELVRELGRGGMGAVFLARRADDEFRKQVAIKVIKRGMDTDFILRRFRSERQILATLDHPNIARLLDGGTTQDGLPYFVMEYIEGLPVNQYCDTNRLPIRERLELFRLICAAVHYAHQNLIIHRDLKPGNILVTKDGTPKLLDFGIAKILDPNLSADTLSPTLTGMRLMTPEYASPEQIRGEVLTPASDIYSLGVLLYEVLTGKRPYRFSSRAPHDIARVVCEEEPETPAMVITKDEFSPEVSTGETIKSLEILSRNRQTTPESLRRELSGDVQNILLKALCKTSDCRYLSAEDFSNDIGAFLSGEPVSAPNSPHITDERFENSFLAASESLAVLPFRTIRVKPVSETGDYLSLGLADALITRLSHLRSVSVRPTSSILKYVAEDTLDPSVAGRELRVTHVLDGRIQHAGKRVRITAQLVKIRTNETVWAGQFDEQSDDILSLQDSISAQVAEALLHKLTGEERRQLEKRGTNNAKAHEAYVRGRFHWHSYTVEGLAKALICFYEAIALDPDFALAYTGVADYYNFLSVLGVVSPKDSFPAAKEAAVKAIELDNSLAEAYTSLGIVEFGYEWDFVEAEKLFKRALELNPNYGEAHVWMAQLHGIHGRHEAALKEMRHAERLNPHSTSLLISYAICLKNAHKYEEALQKLRYALTLQPNLYTALQGYNWVAEPLGIFEEAEKACRQAVEQTERLSLPLYAYGYTLAIGGKKEEARKIAEELEARKQTQFVPSIYNALIYTALDDFDVAFKWLDKSLEERDFWTIWFPIDPRFDKLKTDARYESYVKRIKPLSGIEDIHQSHIATKLLMPVEKEKIARENKALNTPPASRFSKWAILAASSFIVLILVAFFAMRFGWQKGWQYNEQTSFSQKSIDSLPPSQTKNALSIAILPFATIGAKNDDEQYLGVGTADLVTSKLGQINEINLRSASAVRRYLKSDKSPIEAGRELAVDYVVSGTIERKENAVEAKLELREVSGGRIVWSEIFDEPNNDLFALQDSISELVAKSLSLRLTNAEKQNLAKHFTENGNAQQLYLAGRFHFGKRTVEGLRQAISMFEQAIKIDPSFALAYTGLADCFALLNWYEEPQPPDAWNNAKKAAEKAVALDDNLAEAHASLAFIKFHFERDYQGSEEEFRRAVNLKPNYATAYQWYAFLLSSQARHNEAITVMRHAEELEPRSAVIANAVANVLFLARLYDESIAQAKRSLEIDPASVGAHVILRWNYEMKQMKDDVLAIYEKEVGLAGDTPTSRAKQAHVFAALGRKEEALQILRELSENEQIEHITPYEIGVIYTLLDDKTRSLEWLKKAKDEHAVGFSFVKVDPLLDNLRNDKRFESLIK